MSAHKPDALDGALAIIEKIARQSTGGNYLYRGEPKKYERVSSSLYREFEFGKFDSRRYQESEQGRIEFDLLTIAEKEIVEDAKSFTNEIDNFGILTLLQHHGGKTNFIDFTTDYLIALFFACDGEMDENGRVILLQEYEGSKYKIRRPRNPAHRVIAQKSVFVQPPKGYIEEGNFRVIEVPANMKRAMLEHLQKHHGIETKTIYNDVHGYITKRNIHAAAYKKFYRGMICHNYANKETDKTKKDALYSEAVKHYTASIRLNPQNATAYNNRGIANAKQALGDFHGAIADFDQAININPKYAEAYSNRGNAKQALGNLHGAVADYDRAIAINPQYAIAHNNRGNAKRVLGDTQGAIADFDKVIAINSQDTEAFYNRGNAKQALGDYQGAIADYDKTININPKNTDACNNRGTAKQALGDLQGAIADYDEAININPQYAEAYYNRGLAYLTIEDWKQAETDMNSAIKLGLNVAAVFNKAGSIADFEKHYGIKIPPHIAALLQP